MGDFCWSKTVIYQTCQSKVVKKFDSLTQRANHHSPMANRHVWASVSFRAQVWLWAYSTDQRATNC